jgi:hypothetical protein
MLTAPQPDGHRFKRCPICNNIADVEAELQAAEEILDDWDEDPNRLQIWWDEHLGEMRAEDIVFGNVIDERNGGNDGHRNNKLQFQIAGIRGRLIGREENNNGNRRNRRNHNDRRNHINDDNDSEANDIDNIGHNHIIPGRRLPRVVRSVMQSAVQFVGGLASTMRSWSQENLDHDFREEIRGGSFVSKVVAVPARVLES